MRHEEQKIQMDIVQWIRLQYPDVLLTISTGGFLTSAKAGNKAKKLGYNPGVPDLIFFEPRGIYKGLFIELKNETGVCSKEQSQWQIELIERDYFATVCHSFDVAINIIKEYLAIK